MDEQSQTNETKRAEASAKKSELRSVRLTDRASLVLRPPGWRKGEIQRRLVAVCRDEATLMAVDVDMAKETIKLEREVASRASSTTSATISGVDYGRLCSAAEVKKVPVWILLNQAVIDKYQ